MAPSVPLHAVAITLLYLCQSLATSLPGLFPVLIQEAVPGFPVSKLAFMSMWSYPFTVKFIWSLLVDVYFSRSLETTGRVNRRAQWVVPLQLLLAGGYALLALCGESMLAASALEWGATGSPLDLLGAWNLTTLFASVMLLVVLSATQDVAVDAWAVEGLPAGQSGLGGTLQIVGLVLGSCLTNLFLYARSTVRADPTSVLSVFPLTLEFFFGVSAGLCVLGSGLALALSVRNGQLLLLEAEPEVPPAAAAVVARHESDSDSENRRGNATPRPSASASKRRSTRRSDAAPPATAAAATGGSNISGGNDASTVRQLLLSAQDPPVRDMILAMLTRGMASGANSLMQTTLLQAKIILAADLASLRLVCTLLQVAFSVFLAPKVSAARSTGWIFRHANLFDLGVASVSWLAFVAVFETPALQPYYFYSVVCPLAVVGSAMGTIAFMAVVQQSNFAAKRHPAISASIITGLYSAANFGYLFPSSATLFASEPVGVLLGANALHQTATAIGAFNLCAAAVLAVQVLRPATRRMEIHSSPTAPNTTAAAGAPSSAPSAAAVGEAPSSSRRSSSSGAGSSPGRSKSKQD